MRRSVRKTAGYKNGEVAALAEDCARALESVLDQTIHSATVVWNPPMNLLVPFFGGENRLSTPKLVRCDRAVDVSGGTRAVPGGIHWDWVGSGQIRVNEVSGLVVGTKYELTFTVVG